MLIGRESRLFLHIDFKLQTNYQSRFSQTIRADIFCLCSLQQVVRGYKMRQKIESYKREIRRSQIQTYFSSVRNGLQPASQHREISFVINEPIHKRPRLVHFDQTDIYMDNPVTYNSENSCSQHWDNAESHIVRLIEENSFQPLVQTLKDLYRQLKKLIMPNKSNLAFEPKEELFRSFFSKNILANVVSSVIKAFSLRLNGGLLQSLSLQAISIVSLCIEAAPSKFDEELYLNSNLLLFLRYCIEQPKHDYKNLSRVIGIMTHMILASDGATNRLFCILNDRKSPFHVGAIFYNISKMPLRTDDALSEHLINMLAHYLLKIQDQILIAKNDQVAVVSQTLTCLTVSELQIAIQIAVNAINNLVGICISNSQKEDYLEEALDVLRIIIQNFEVKENYKNKLNFRKFLQIISIKGFRNQMKTSVFMVIDHLVYKDSEGYFTETLVKEYEMLDIIWPLRDTFATYVMNIMCNLALDPKLKTSLNKYVHEIYLNLNLGCNAKMLYDFVYNWFSSQNFEIITSNDKLMVMTLRDSEQNNPKIAQLQCALWYNLAKYNEVQIPQRILHYDFPIVRRIKEEILSHHDTL